MLKAHSRDQHFTESRLTQAKKIKAAYPNKFVEFIDDEPESPRLTLHLWTLYNRLLYGREKVTHGEIFEYCSLMGVKLANWEVELMIELDMMRLTVND